MLTPMFCCFIFQIEDTYVRYVRFTISLDAVYSFLFSFSQTIAPDE